MGSGVLVREGTRELEAGALGEGESVVEALALGQWDEEGEGMAVVVPLRQREGEGDCVPVLLLLRHSEGEGEWVALEPLWLGEGESEGVRLGVMLVLEDAVPKITTAPAPPAPDTELHSAPGRQAPLQVLVFRPVAFPKYPAAHLPLHCAVVKPAVSPYVPRGQGVQAALPARAKVPALHC